MAARHEYLQKHHTLRRAYILVLAPIFIAVWLLVLADGAARGAWRGVRSAMAGTPLLKPISAAWRGSEQSSNDKSSAKSAE